MRWVLAALSFALLVGLAVTTAATRADNLSTRKRLHTIEFGQAICAIECARREQAVQPLTAPAELARRYRALQRLEQEFKLALLH